MITTSLSDNEVFSMPFLEYVTPMYLLFTQVSFIKRSGVIAGRNLRTITLGNKFV